MTVIGIILAFAGIATCFQSCSAVSGADAWYNMMVGAVLFFAGFACIGISDKRSGESSNQGRNSAYITMGKTSGSFVSILNKLEMVVSEIVRHDPHETIMVRLQIKKIRGTYCGIDFLIWLDHSSFSKHGITFGNEFKVSDNSARYTTKSAPGYTNVEDVKRELLLQFNWPNISVALASFQVLGPDKEILYSFDVRRKET